MLSTAGSNQHQEPQEPLKSSNFFISWLSLPNMKSAFPVVPFTVDGHCENYKKFAFGEVRNEEFSMNTNLWKIITKPFLVCINAKSFHFLLTESPLGFSLLRDKRCRFLYQFPRRGIRFFPIRGENRCEPEELSSKRIRVSRAVLRFFLNRSSGNYFTNYVTGAWRKLSRWKSTYRQRVESISELFHAIRGLNLHYWRWFSLMNYPVNPFKRFPRIYVYDVACKYLWEIVFLVRWRGFCWTSGNEEFLLVIGMHRNRPWK